MKNKLILSQVIHNIATTFTLNIGCLFDRQTIKYTSVLENWYDSFHNLVFRQTLRMMYKSG